MAMMEDPSKAILRRAALAQRQALLPDEMAHRSQQLCEQFLQYFPVAQWRWLHVFLPLAKHNEPDTWLIIRRIWTEAWRVRLAAPVVQPDGINLKHFELTPSTPLRDSRWGIPEPLAAAATEISSVVFDAVLVPLLAVDEAGHRVGYGGGFYDRFLAQCNPNTQFIGINVLDDAPVARIADVLPTDVPLHACLTPSSVWHF